jgi:hypothetical protein
MAGLLQGDQELELFDVHDGTCWGMEGEVSIDSGGQDTRFADDLIVVGERPITVI